MPKPVEFKRDKELLSKLKKKNLSRWFDKSLSSAEDIVLRSVGGNTFRAFHNTPNKPSVVYRNWARKELKSKKFLSGLRGIGTIGEYDKWIELLSKRFVSYWNKEMGPGKEMPYGPARKLQNLLMKQVVLWDELKKREKDRIIKFLHIPFDSYTLLAIRNSIADVKIPKSATMRFVENRKMYNALIDAARQISKRAEVPPILIDVLAWDEAHLHELRQERKMKISPRERDFWKYGKGTQAANINEILNRFGGCTVREVFKEMKSSYPLMPETRIQSHLQSLRENWPDHFFKSYGSPCRYYLKRPYTSRK